MASSHHDRMTGPQSAVRSSLSSRFLGAIAVGATAITLATGCAHWTTALAGPEGPTLQERQAAFLESLVAKDLERVVALFAEDAVVHVADMPPIRGRDAIRRLYGNVFRFLESSEYVPEMLRVSQGVDLAYGTGIVTTVFTEEEGVVEYRGKYLVVWQKRDGVWLAVAYGVSNNGAHRAADAPGADALREL